MAKFLPTGASTSKHSRLVNVILKSMPRLRNTSAALSYPTTSAASKAVAEMGKLTHSVPATQLGEGLLRHLTPRKKALTRVAKRAAVASLLAAVYLHPKLHAHLDRIVRSGVAKIPAFREAVDDPRNSAVWDFLQRGEAMVEFDEPHLMYS
ncbi:MAG: hypothetical protein COB29_00930 [Sulfitobacter sp.]|nr:MAG: hypothetical protein COB29_00930 [Sulfitobacter sp.]